MEFRILGPLEVVHGSRRIDLGPYKQRGVLALLLMAGGRVVSLDRLIDQLWREQPPPSATASLQAYVSRLRRILEPDRGPRDPARVLVTQPPGYVLRLDDSEVDARRFEAAAVEGRRLLEEGRPAAAGRALEEALGLWRGGALEDFSFEPFAEAEIRRLEELRLAAVEDHVVAELALGRHAAVVPRLEALVGEHPLRERLWEMLMVALYRSGRQTEALRAFQGARAALAEQLGLEPGPNLRRLEADVLAHADSLEWRPVREERPVRSTGASPREPGREIEDGRPPLIGRDPALAVLDGVLRSAGRRQGGVVLVDGDAGIGKTRLLRELAARAEDAGFRVLWGETHEAAAEMPFWPWAQLLGRLVASSGPELVRTALGPAAAGVGHVLPELADALGSAASPVAVDLEASRLRMFEGISRVVLAAADEDPLLLVLDDMHWADEASLQLVAFVAARLRGRPIVVAGAYRAADVPPAHPLTAVLASLAREGVVTRVALAGLDLHQVGELIEATTGRQAPGDVVSVVHQRTEGNPFFASELVRLLSSEQTLEVDAATLARAVPAGVADVVSRRVARLPEPTVGLLSMASVLGPRLDLAELAAASGGDIGGVIDDLEPAVLTGILVQDGESVGRLRFSHALVQDAIYRGLTSLRRAELHGRVAGALDRLVGHDDERAPELSRHFSLAGPTADPLSALRHALRAADVSRDRFLYDQALLHLGRALDGLGRLPAGTDRDRMELEVLTRRSVILALTQGYSSEEVATASGRAHALSVRVGDTDQLTASLWSVWAMWVVRGDLAAGGELAEKLFELGVETGDVRPMIGGHQATGTTAAHRGDLVMARDHLVRSVQLADGLDDPSLPDLFLQHPAVFSRGFLAVVEWLLGHRDEAAARSSEALDVAGRLDHPFTLSLALFFDAWLGVLEEAPGPALVRAEEAVALSDRHQFALVSEMSAVVAGWATARGGRPVEGCARAAEGLSRMEARQARMLRPFFLGLLADAHRSGGGADHALPLVDAALAEAERVGERFYEAELHRMRAELLTDLGASRELALASLDRAWAVAGDQAAAGLRRRLLDSSGRLGALA